MNVETSDRVDGLSEGDAPIDMVGGRLEFVARAEAAGADAVMARSTIAPGRAVPLHSHVDYECFHVLSGRLDVFIEGRGWTAVEAGHSAVVAKGERHAIRNTTSVPVEVVVVFNNRLAQFFQDAGAPGVRDAPPAPPSPEGVAHLRAVMARYGYWLATPEEHAAITG